MKSQADIPVRESLIAFLCDDKLVVCHRFVGHFFKYQ